MRAPVVGGQAPKSGRMVGSWAVSAPARVEAWGGGRKCIFSQVWQRHSSNAGTDTKSMGIRGNTPKLCFSPPELVSPHIPRTLMSIGNSKLSGRTEGPRDPGYITVLLCARCTVYCT